MYRRRLPWPYEAAMLYAARCPWRCAYLRVVVNSADDSDDGPSRSTSGSRYSCCAPGFGSVDQSDTTVQVLCE